MKKDTVLMEEMSWPEIKTAIEGGQTTVILAVGAIEQHGPHLPTGTDTYGGYGRAEGITLELGDALVAPVMRPGLSEHHTAFPGTITLSQETFIRVLMEYCESLARHGFQDIVLLSAHGGNTDTMLAVMPRIGKALAGKCRVHMPAPNLSRMFDDVLAVYKEYGVTRGQAGAHSGWSETSSMLCHHPGLVDMDKAADGRSDEAFYHPDEIKYSQLESFVFGIHTQAPNGILGDARGASAEAGRKLHEIQSKQGAEEIRKMISVAKKRGA